MKANRSITDYFLFAEAWLLLALARLMLVFLPFKKIIPLLGKPDSNAAPAESQNNDSILSAIKLAIMRSCGYSPWRTKCFEQALAAKIMLKRRGLTSIISFGVYKDDDSNKLNAHAWLQCSGQVITGGNKLDKYTVLSSFKS